MQLPNDSSKQYTSSSKAKPKNKKIRKDIPKSFLRTDRLENSPVCSHFGLCLQSIKTTKNAVFAILVSIIMDFFNSAVDVLQTLVIALGAGLCIWGGINLLEGYGNDNPGAKSQGIKQLMAGGGVALIGVILVPLLSGLFG